MGELDGRWNLEVEEGRYEADRSTFGNADFATRPHVNAKTHARTDTGSNTGTDAKTHARTDTGSDTKAYA